MSPVKRGTARYSWPKPQHSTPRFTPTYAFPYAKSRSERQVRTESDALPPSWNSFQLSRRLRLGGIMKLLVLADQLLEGGMLIGIDLVRELGGGAAPLGEPITGEHFAPRGERGMKGGGSKRNRRLELFSGIASPSHIETGGQERGAIRGRAGVGEELGGPPGAGCKYLAKGGERPDIAGSFGREHVVKDEARRGWRLRDGVEKVSRQQPPAQTGMLP